jgi:diacylglycerol kinase (ATP)
MRIGLIINPAANAGRGAKAGLQVQELLLDAGLAVLNLSANTLEQARENGHRAIASKLIDGLIVVGGDGMVHLATNLCAQTEVPFGLVAAGTGNDAARTLGLPVANVPAAVRAILDNLEKPRAIDAVRATSTAGEFWFLGSISAGFDALVASRANKMRWPKGPARYTVAMLLELAKFKPIKFDAVIDGKSRKFEAMLCAVCNTKGFGGGLLAVPDASIDDGQFDLFIVHGISRLELIRMYPKAFKGLHVGHPAVEILRAKDVSLASGDMPAYADGESVGRAPITAKIVPGALRVFAAN